MLNVFRPSVLSTSLLCLVTLFALPAAHAQAPVTELSRQLGRLDLGVSGVGQFTNSVTGTNYLGVSLTQKPSTTLGALVTVRYTKSPLLGAEFNYGYARYTQNYSSYIVGGAQTNANEYTVGYVAHTPRIFGFQTFVSGGGGTIEFKGTPGGGQGLPTQARAAYYYDAGIEDSLLPHLGIRAQFRQVFFLAPDFGQNYLTIKQRQITTEPGIGIYLHF